ncbi:LysM peptidoglycan-binding domain-containing protein [Metabacillus litoralis]|uniref:LysM peptidoglycan-binding domain-containing protein n=1 Tax=Metabacillus litoralis TaxID=152268 RepID=UPI001CFC7E87|nr:LysM domain-containing protein [Metabacillus litoralis]
MKRFSLLLLCLFICYIAYYDFRVGTLPAVSQAASDNTTVPVVTTSISQKKSINYFEHKVKQGDTVLSIIEKYHSMLPASIEQISKDFEELNSDVKAHSIVTGQIYRFPSYKQ